ncbi:MAG: AAA family ATPase [Gammaproteobacteria bacterium]
MNDNTNNNPNDIDLQSSNDLIKKLESSISLAIVGQNDVIRQILVTLIAAGHALIEGVPGTGKTLLVRSLASAVGGKFNRVQFTPDLMPSDVTGHVMYDMKTTEFKVRRGPVFCNFLLADEINRAPAKTQSSLLEVMQEQQVTIEGNSYQLQEPFLVLATQNPIEQEGTYPLPEAQLDRFLLKIKIDYPSHEDEVSIVKQVTSQSVGDKLDLSAVTQQLTPEQVVSLQQTAAKLHIDEQIIQYSVRIVTATRNRNGIDIGSGPRGSIALLRAARANALINGNNFVTPDDVKSVAPNVLRHRLTLNADLEIEGYPIDKVIEDILKEVDAPRI